MTLVKDIENFKYGVVNKIEKKSIPVGSAADMLNFRTKGDKTEIRRGQNTIGTLLDPGTGSQGVHTAYKADGTAILFRKRGRKLEYYDADAEDWEEIGTNLFPTAAEEDDATFANYQSQAGAQVFISSPNSSIYKIMVANPDSYTDLSSTTYRGYIIIEKNRMHLWNRRDTNYQKDLTAVYLSWIDNQQYTTVSAESIDVGGAATSYSHTLAFKGGGAKRTCFAVVVKVNGTVKFTDDYNGNLVAIDGPSYGSGTVNYTTGEITLTFASAPNQAITTDYQWEDSTDEGVADFSFGSPRAPGEGDVLRQDEGGTLQAEAVYNDNYFGFHERTIYQLVLSADDADASNTVYRKNVGVPNHRAVCPTGDGIYFVDTATAGDTQIRLLRLEAQSTEIVPVSISRQLDLSSYDFTDSWIKRQGNLVLIGCKTSGATANNRVLVYDEIFKTWDILDYFSNCADLFEGAVVMGDSVSGNVFTAFSGFDDDDAAIPASWEGNEWDLGATGTLKKVKGLVFEGEIAPAQIIDVDFLADDGSYSNVGQIRGDGDYVDRSQRVAIGAETIGREEVGGGSDGAYAYHYLVELPLRQGKWQKGQIRIRVGTDSETGDLGLGYFSFSLIRYQDIRIKQRKIPRKYRT